MIRVGIVGIGFMGWIHYLAYQRLRGVKVAAIVSRDAAKREGDWRTIRGNFGPPGEQVALGRIARHERLADLLGDPKIDLVDICLPPNLHAQATVAALEAGKHVVCEKPIALRLAEAERMVTAARRAKRQLFIAHVLPFFPEYAFAYEAAKRRRFGRVLGGHFRRVISDPTWLKDFYDPGKVGGPVVDLHVHDAHFIRLLFGQPQRLFSTGTLRGEVVERFTTQFLFDDASQAVSAAGGVIHQQGRPFTHGFEIYFEKATLLFEFAALAGEPPIATPLTVLEANGRVAHPELLRADEIAPFVAELGEVVRCIRRNAPSARLSGELARDALRLCHEQTRSVRTGKVVSL